jgi:hypothetical protein
MVAGALTFRSDPRSMEPVSQMTQRGNPLWGKHPVLLQVVTDSFLATVSFVTIVGSSCPTLARKLAYRVKVAEGHSAGNIAGNGLRPF